MSPRLLAVLMLTISATAMATETTTETVAEETQATAEAVVEETQAAAEQIADEAEAAAQEVTEEVEAVAEETQAAVEEAATEAEAAAQQVTEEVEAAAGETQTAVEETATELPVTETEDGVKAVEVTEPSEIAKDAAAEQTADDGSELQAKLAACAACHGADGNSVIPQNPKLAGQVPGYIADQLAKFKSGERENAIMAAQAANLTEEDMLAIDEFYASQQPQLGAVPEEMLEQALVGERIFRGGEPSMSISACMSCHGPNGDGIPVRFPRVSGQHVEYLEQTLLAYKSGARKSDVMNSIAFRLSEQQIKSLALYMHGLK